MGTLEEDVQFIENPDPRCPCMLLLDTSGSMVGKKIELLNQGLQIFQADMNKDTLARRRCEVAIITFGNGGVQTVQDFITVDRLQVPHLQPGGNTPMGEALYQAVELLEKRKQTYKSNGIGYYRPWLFLITDGIPTDEKWRDAARRVQTEDAKKGLAFFVVGVDGADQTILRQIAASNRPPVILQKAKVYVGTLYVGYVYGVVYVGNVGVGWAVVLAMLNRIDIVRNITIKKVFIPARLPLKLLRLLVV
jgi:uncharacterized protein YegL